MVIGIDPSFRKNGFSICMIGGGEALFKTFNSFLEFAEWLFYYKLADTEEWKEFATEMKFVIENSNLQNVTFDMIGSKAVVAKKSRDVGKNQAISQATVDLCNIFYPGCVIEISPAQKGRKVEEPIFSKIVDSLGIKLQNYKGRKNEQDKRDAFMLAQKFL